MHTLSSHTLAWLLLSLITAACGPDTADHLGGLTLGLTTQTGGVAYRLADARFTLEGPAPRELVAMGEDELSVTLPAGAYRLTLQDGYRLARIDTADAGAGATVAARLITENPVPVLVAAGETAHVTLRFDLGTVGKLAPGEGTLRVDVAVGTGGLDGGAADDQCALGLRINELDYEQASSDAAEFIELLNPGRCAAPLAGLTLELVNGTDQRPYARYALADAAPSLGAGERLVIGDPAILARLPAQVKQLALNGSGLQNGPDAVRLVRGEQVIDALAYEEAVAGSSEGTPTASDDGEPGISRCPDGFDTQNNGRDAKLAPPTPGAPNQCAAAQNRSATMPSSMSQR